MPDRFTYRATILILGLVLLTASGSLGVLIQKDTADMERIVALIGLITTVGAWLVPSPLQTTARRGSDFTSVETPQDSTVTIEPNPITPEKT